MSFIQIEKDNKLFLRGKISAKNYADKIMRNVNCSRYGITVISKSMPMNDLKQLCKK